MTRQSNLNNTKEALRHHARRLFARHGYDGVSMRDLADAVGIQQSGIYNHFASKQILLVDLMVVYMERVMAELQAEVSNHTDPVSKLKAFVQFTVIDHINCPDDVFLAFMELRSLENPGLTKLLALRDAYETVLRDILSEGIRSRLFNVTDLDIATRALLAMLSGVTVWYKEDGPLGREKIADVYVQLVLQSVGATDQRSPST